MILCPTCNNENADHERHCLRCGRPLSDIAPETSSPEEEPAEDVAKTLAMKIDNLVPDLSSPMLASTTDETLDNDLEGVVSIPASPRQRQATLVEPIAAVGLGEVAEEIAVLAKPHNAETSDTRPEADEKEVFDTSPMRQTIPAMEALPRHTTGVETPIKPNSNLRKLLIWLAFLCLLIAIAGASVFHLMTSHPATNTAEVSTNVRLTIEGGPFLKGLSNDYRLIFSDTCRKIADNPDTECKEDIALKDEFPQETVDVPTFALDAHEVSQQEWADCVKAGSCKKIERKGCQNHTLQGHVPFLEVPDKLFAPELPVICVDRAQAAGYCAWKGGRLPSPDEWEKAARGKDAYLFPWGSNWNPVVANWAEQDMARVFIAGLLDGHTETAPVHSMPEGCAPSGAHHMAGNVAEWVSPAEGKDKELLGTARGGSWLSNPAQLRTTGRQAVKIDARRSDLGLRCAYDKP